MDEMLTDTEPHMASDETRQALLGDRLVDVESLEPPADVRTPGRTWTTFDVDGVVPGHGTISVKDPEQEDVEILSLNAAYATYPDMVAQVFFNELDPEENRVTQLHAQHLRHAIFVRIPDGVVVENPVEIETTAHSGLFPHHVLVHVGKGAVVKIVERNTGRADCDTALTELYVAEDASITYTKINMLDGGNGYADGAATVADDATMQWTLMSIGSDLYRNTTTTHLAGPRSSLQYNLGFLAANDQHMDITTHVLHNADNTRCDMDSRGVALDQSRTVYKGVQEVKENAEQTESFQDETTVMIGDRCEADTTPQLQIDNNDVVATHAATTGHINEEDLFYMKSRGLHETAAKREIITGMFDDLIESENDDGKGIIHEKIRETLG